MVSTRRTASPSSSLPNLANARPVPDEPPPPPLRPNVIHGEPPASARPLRSNVVTKDMILQSSDGVLPCTDEPLTLSIDVEENVPTVQTDDGIPVDDSDAPEEEFSSAVASAARLQLRKERMARAAAKDAHRAQRRARTQGDGATEKESVSREKEAIEVEAGVGKIRNDEEKLPLRLPEDVLLAAVDAIGDQKKIEQRKKHAQNLKKQKNVIGRTKSLKVASDGLQVAIMKRSKRSLKSARPGKKSAASFLQENTKKVGVSRVSAAAALRIASKKSMKA